MQSHFSNIRIEPTINYTYDDAGNRLTERRNGVQTNYTYDEDNRMTSKGTATYSYDDNGNLIQKDEDGQITNYTWDYENRLMITLRLRARIGN